MGKVTDYRSSNSNSLKDYFIIRITAAFWIAAKIISFKVWMAERLFPLVPVFNFTANFSPILHITLFWLSILSMMLLFFLPKNKALLLFVIILEITACLMDITRWQPWEYQYLLTLFLFLLYSKKQLNFRVSFVFLVSMLYIYSGLYKINGGFLYAVWERLILIKFAGFSHIEIQNTTLHYSGLLMPVIETTAGLALLFFKNKKLPAFVLVCMHSILLIILGPFGIHYNIVIWPWNLAMIFLLHFLFFRSSVTFSLSSVRLVNPVLILLCGIMPALSFKGYWDEFLSFGLYSGNSKYIDACIADKNIGKEFEPYISKKDPFFICDGETRLQLHDMSMKEMNVPLYPEKWYFERLKKKWMEKYPGMPVDFVIYSYPYKEKIKLE